MYLYTALLRAAPTVQYVTMAIGKETCTTDMVPQKTCWTCSYVATGIKVYWTTHYTINSFFTHGIFYVVINIPKMCQPQKNSLMIVHRQDSMCIAWLTCQSLITLLWQMHGYMSGFLWYLSNTQLFRINVWF